MRGKIGKLTAILLGLGAAALSIPLVLGFFGVVHPAFDSLSHFRIHLAAAVTLAGVLLLFFPGWRLNGAVALALGIAATVATLGLPFSGLRAQASAGAIDAPRYRLLQMNLRFDNPQPEAVLSLIGEMRPDVITLNEVSAMWREKLALLEAAYPYRIVCPPPAYIGGSAILSRRPFTSAGARCEDRGSLAVATVDFGGEAVDIAALHLGWPWPFEQPRQVRKLAAAFAGIGDRAILAGDFNATAWSQTVRRVAEAGNFDLVQRVGPTWLDRRLPSWLRPHIGLPIDHVLVKGGVLADAPRRLAAVGSDHLPVLMEFTVLPEEQAPSVMRAMLGNSGITQQGSM
jgi:endonuclease/exonuclease/phosphatase (EEP) superfamily protein YafD